MCVHILFIGKCQRRGSALSLQYLLHACWEWIAATVQATRLHLEIDLSRGGTVVAISLSTVCMQRAACLSVVHVVSHRLVHVGLPSPPPISPPLPFPPKEDFSKLLCFSFILHNIQSMSIVVGAWDSCRDRLRQPCRPSHPDRPPLR